MRSNTKVNVIKVVAAGSGVQVESARAKKDTGSLVQTLSHRWWVQMVTCEVVPSVSVELPLYDSQQTVQCSAEVVEVVEVVVSGTTPPPAYAQHSASVHVAAAQSEVGNGAFKAQSVVPHAWFADQSAHVSLSGLKAWQVPPHIRLVQIEF